MTRRLFITLFVVFAGVALSLSPASPIGEAEATDTPAAVALRYVAEHRQELGLAEADLVDVVVTDAYTSGHTGVSHVYLRQRFRGVEV